jgi:hypothetical protein
MNFEQTQVHEKSGRYFHKMQHTTPDDGTKTTRKQETPPKRCHTVPAN